MGIETTGDRAPRKSRMWAFDGARRARQVAASRHVWSAAVPLFVGVAVTRGLVPSAYAVPAVAFMRAITSEWGARPSTATQG